MNKAICSQEMSVAAAVRTGQWDDSLKDHVAACPDCSEVMRTVRAMQSLALPADGESAMPEAARLWCLALLEEKQKDAARARRSLAAVEFATTALLALGSVAWLAWSWPELEAQLTAWQTSLWPRLWQVAWFLAEQTPGLASLPAVFVLLLLVAAAAFLLAQPLLAED